MSYEEGEKFEIGRAKHSKAGRVHVDMPGQSHRQAERTPEAVVKVTGWAKSGASVKRMMDYVAREIGPGDEGNLSELERELAEQLASKSLHSEDLANAQFLKEMCSLHREYELRIKEIEASRRESFAAAKGDKPRIAELRTHFDKKREDNAAYASAHVWNMGEAHGVDLGLAIRTSNAFQKHHRQAEQIRTLRDASAVAKHHRNNTFLKRELYEVATATGLPLAVLATRDESKQKHPKARPGVALVLENEMGMEFKGAAEIQNLYDRWSEDFDRKEKGKPAPRQAVHIALSAKSDLTETNVERVKAAARATAQKHFGSAGYEYVLGVHQDGKYPHAHLIVKCKQRETGKKLDLRKADLHALRKTYAKELTARGLAHVATKAKDRPRTDVRKPQRPSNWQPTVQAVLAETKALVAKMEKEERAFKRRLGRARPSVDAIGFREAQARSLVTQRDKIKALPKHDEQIKGIETQIGRTTDEPERKRLAQELAALKKADLDRREAFNTLRDYRRRTEKGANMEQESKATLTELLDSMDRWNKDSEKMQKTHLLGMSPQDRIEAVKGREKHIEQGGKLMDRADDFIARLKTMNMPVEEKKQTFRTLREKSLSVKKVRTRLQGRER
ncbi:MAG: relaxase/mobilization nuclease domain-containing protein [Sphaerochaeta sp.]|nr:relaxase/mobilization nuclease domain-containing protein [Sphaerochaeta sp.]